MGQREVSEAQTYFDVSNKIKVLIFFSISRIFYFFKSLNLTYPNETSHNYTLDFYSFGEIMSAAQVNKSKKIR